jgi:hypothetical protein
VTAAPAAAPQELALRYLNKQALACYWLQLLREYTELLTYDPGQPGSGAAGYERPLDLVVEELRQHPDMQGPDVWPEVELLGPMRDVAPAAAGPSEQRNGTTLAGAAAVHLPGEQQQPDKNHNNRTQPERHRRLKLATGRISK